MRILLPPSEAKAAGGRGRPVGVRGLSGPLAEPRSRVLDALELVLASGPEAAVAALQLPAGAADQALRDNGAVSTSGTVPSLRRYTGVVYQGLHYGGLSPAAQRLAARSVFVMSGLWGIVRGDEPIPAYRVPAKARLPGLGIAGAFWRPVLDAVLPGLLAGQFVVDLRSTDYTAMWRPPRGFDGHVLSVRVLSALPGGRLGVVSHPSKLGKGRLAAALVERAAAGTPCSRPDDVIEAWTDCGGVAARARGATALDLILP